MSNNYEQKLSEVETLKILQVGIKRKKEHLIGNWWGKDSLCSTCTFSTHSQILWIPNWTFLESLLTWFLPESPKLHNWLWSQLWNLSILTGKSGHPSLEEPWWWCAWMRCFHFIGPRHVPQSIIFIIIIITTTTTGLLIIIPPSFSVDTVIVHTYWLCFSFLLFTKTVRKLSNQKLYYFTLDCWQLMAHCCLISICSTWESYKKCRSPLHLSLSSWNHTILWKQNFSPPPPTCINKSHEPVSFLAQSK